MAVSSLIFDVDDTLYDVSTGFTAHRNGEAAQRFMVEYLNFPDLESAKTVRDAYFERYHATAKALTVAEQEGKFPPPDPNKLVRSPRFQTKDLAEYWAKNLNFELLGKPKTNFLEDLKALNLNLVAFSNGPRKYVIRVLEQLGLMDIFGEDRLFAVDDTMPYCKPEKEAFDAIFQAVGVKASDCVMIEDSMKNIRRAKTLGMKTVLVMGAGRMRKNGLSTAEASEATKPGDAPVDDDPSVDVAIETVEEMRNVLPGLWETPAIFAPKR